ncbi:MAG: GerMN domain-containing protein [Ilumatobacteraceae bacterium]
MNVLDQRRRAGRPGLLILIVVIGLTSCGIDTDSAPRDISESNRSPLVAAATQAASVTTGSDRIFLLAPEAADEPHQLRASTRDVGDSATQRLRSLFGALTVAETSARLRTAIPEGLELRSAVVQANGVVVIDVTDELLTLSRTSLVDAVAQIVFTAAEVQGVSGIVLRVTGQNLQWPAGDGELQSRPLTVYDYPGFIESTQPDFPAVPSPGDA